MLDKDPRNEKREPHGLWESYYTDYHGDTILWYIGWYINNVDVGYWIEEETILIYYAR
jgi:hypothetical protein